MNYWKLSTLVFFLLAASIFFVEADFSPDSKVPPPDEQENRAPYAEEILAMEDRLRSGVVTLTAAEGHGTFGTGFLVHEDGYIFTNAHVVEGHEELGVDTAAHTKRGTPYTAEVVAAADKGRVDFAVLKTNQEMEDVTPLELGDPVELSEGDTAFGIGHPGTLGSYVITAGEVIDTAFVDDNILVDKPGWSGQSGSPLFNMDGEVVGVIYSTHFNKSKVAEHDAVVWHGNEEDHLHPSSSQAARVDGEVEAFFREEFSENLSDEIFGGGPG